MYVSISQSIRFLSGNISVGVNGVILHVKLINALKYGIGEELSDFKESSIKLLFSNITLALHTYKVYTYVCM